MFGTILNTSGSKNEITRETQIYRTISKKRLLELFTNQENWLARPSQWQDTFENLALNSEFEIGGERGKFEFKDDVYGQCWTLATASDAIWRIYSKRTNGVRIRSTVGKVLDSLGKTESVHHGVSCFMGKVAYKTEKELNEFAENHFRDGLLTDGSTIASSLLIKRIAFSHEKEVRIVYISPDKSPADKDFHKYKFDAKNVVDQIMLHPQLSSQSAKRLMKKIERETHFNGEIKHSQLYRLPKGFVFKVGG